MVSIALALRRIKEDLADLLSASFIEKICRKIKGVRMIYETPVIHPDTFSALIFQPSCSRTTAILTVAWGILTLLISMAVLFHDHSTPNVVVYGAASICGVAIIYAGWRSVRRRQSEKGT